MQVLQDHHSKSVRKLGRRNIHPRRCGHVVRVQLFYTTEATVTMASTGLSVDGESLRSGRAC